MPRPATRVLVWAAAWTSALAQLPTPWKFEIAAAKLDADNDGHFLVGSYPGSNLTARDVTPKMLMMRAYRLHSFQVSGDPDWVNNHRWDIRAKAEGTEGRLPNTNSTQCSAP